MASRRKKSRLFSIRTLIKLLVGTGLLSGGGYTAMNFGLPGDDNVASVADDSTADAATDSVHGDRLISEFADQSQDDSTNITALMSQSADSSTPASSAGFRKPDSGTAFPVKPAAQSETAATPTSKPPSNSFAGNGSGTFSKPAAKPNTFPPAPAKPTASGFPQKPAAKPIVASNFSDKNPFAKPPASSSAIPAKRTSLADLLSKNKPPADKPAAKPPAKPTTQSIAQNSLAARAPKPAAKSEFKPLAARGNFSAAPSNKPAPVIAQTKPKPIKPQFENASAVTSRPKQSPGAQQNLLADAEAARRKVAPKVQAPPRVVPQKIDPDTNSQFSSVGSGASGLNAPPRTSTGDRPQPERPESRQQPASVPNPQALANTRTLGNAIPSRPNNTQPLAAQPPRTQAPRSQADPQPTATAQPRTLNIGNVSTVATSAAATDIGKPGNKPGDRGLEGIQTPTLSLEKSAPREIQVGRPATFRLVVRNNGRVPAYGVTIVDAVPQGTKLTSTRPNPTSQNGAELTWNLGTLEPGESSEIIMELTPQQRGEIGSVARVSFQSQASVRAICTKPQLEIQHTAPNKVLIGEIVLLRINVRNTGDGAATGVMIEENVPENMVHADSQGRKLQYPVGTLAPGESRDLTLRLRAENPGQALNTITTSGDGQLFAKDELNVDVVAPKLQLDARGPSRRFIERQAIYDLSIANLGTASATNVQMVAKLPRGMRFVEADKNGQYDQRTHSVYWSLIELPTDSKGEVKLTLLPIDTGNQIIDYQAKADLNIVQNRELPVTVEQYSELFFDVDDVADPIEVGSDTVYHIRVVNQGSQTATNVRLQVKTPDSLQPISAAGATQHQIAGNTIVFAPIERLAPNAEAKFEVQVKGNREGDHRISVELSSDERTEVVAKEESTKVYSDYR